MKEVTWLAEYRDQSLASEHTGTPYGEIDRQNLAWFRVYQGEKVIAEISNRNFYFRRRTKLTPGVGAKIVYLFGIWDKMNFEYDPYLERLTQAEQDIEPFDFEPFSQTLQHDEV